MSGITQTILLIEDEAPIRSFLRISLEANGYKVLEARTGESGLAIAGESQPQLVILDLGLPDIDGQEVIRRLREWSEVPVLILSVRQDERDKVTALDSGANDFVTKPANVNELMARVRVLLRKRDDGQADAAIYERNGLRIDLARREVSLQGVPVSLTRKEYDLLRMLVRNSGLVLTHQQLLRELWGPSFTGETHYLRIVISTLRQKLNDDPADPRYIVTEQGVGYRLLDQ
jgi:two-component system, OmpR family, KDP operon response regulator KdpE